MESKARDCRNKCLLSICVTATVFVSIEDGTDHPDAATVTVHSPGSGPAEAPKHSSQAAPEVIFADSEYDDYDAYEDPEILNNVI